MNNNKLVDKVDRSFAAIADWSIKWRWLVVFFALLFVSLGFLGMSKVHIDNSVDGYFDKSDPTYIAYVDYLDDFLSDEVAYILYRVPNTAHGPFDLEAMRTIGTLTEALANEVPFTHEVTSLANVEFIRAEGDSINVDKLLIDFPSTQEELLAIRDTVLSKPLYVNYLVNQQADYAAIIIEMNRTSIDPLANIIYDPNKGDGMENLYPQVSNAKIREILKRPEYEGIEFYLSGDVAMNSAYNEIITEDSSYIMLATLLLIMLMSFLLFRATLIGMLGPITVVIISVVLTMGFIGALGWSIGLFFAMVPTLLCAVGVAQSVHILLEFQRVYAATSDRNSAVKAALYKVGAPCMMAALTTAVGFLVMSTSSLKTLSELAVYSSVGVLITFILSVTLLVVFLAGSDKKPAKKPRAYTINPFVIGLVKRSIDINLKYNNRVIIIGLLLIASSGLGINKLVIDFNFLDEFKPHVEWRKHTEQAERVMGGMLPVTYIIDTKTTDGIKNPAVLAAIEKVQHFAEQDPLVKKSFSVTDIIKDINRSFNADDPNYYTLPKAQDLTAQYFLVYEMSGGAELEELVSLDFSRTVLEFRVELTNGTEVIKLIEKIDQFLADNPIPNAELSKTGIGLMWIVICDYIGDTQLVSYSLVFIMIALFMCISFGSIKVGLLSMVPNLAPIVITLGAMGWFNIHLDYMKLLLATIAIGIAVDDTIHLVTRYRSRFMETGNYSEALKLSLSDVGPALVITSIILICAFSSYLFSNTVILASFGVLLAATILLALLADLFLMPALILKLKPFGEEFNIKKQLVGKLWQPRKK